MPWHDFSHTLYLIILLAFKLCSHKYYIIRIIWTWMASWLGFRDFLPAVCLCSIVLSCIIIFFFLFYCVELFIFLLPCSDSQSIFFHLSLLSFLLICLYDSFHCLIIMFCSRCCLCFSGIMGLQHPGVLVHRIAWAEPAVPILDLWRAAQLLLDDRLFQPAGLPDSNETGTHGVELPTYLPTAREDTRWHAEAHIQTCTRTHKHSSSFSNELQFLIMW